MSLRDISPIKIGSIRRRLRPRIEPSKSNVSAMISDPAAREFELFIDTEISLQRQPSQETLHSVLETLERKGHSLCGRISAQAFVTLFELFKQSIADPISQRGLCLLSDGLALGETASSVASQSAKGNDGRLRHKRIEIGKQIFDRAVGDFCNTELSFGQRRWMGILALDLSKYCQGSLDFLKSDPNFKRSLGALTIQDPSVIIKFLAGLLIRETVSYGFDASLYWPANTKSAFPAAFLKLCDATAQLQSDERFYELTVAIEERLQDPGRNLMINVSAFEFSTHQEGVSKQIRRPGLLQVVQHTLHIFLLTNDKNRPLFFDIPLAVVKRTSIQKALGIEPASSLPSNVVYIFLDETKKTKARENGLPAMYSHFGVVIQNLEKAGSMLEDLNHLIAQSKMRRSSQCKTSIDVSVDVDNFKAPREACSESTSAPEADSHVLLTETKTLAAQQHTGKRKSYENDEKQLCPKKQKNNAPNIRVPANELKIFDMLQSPPATSKKRDYLSSAARRARKTEKTPMAKEEIRVSLNTPLGGKGMQDSSDPLPSKSNGIELMHCASTNLKRESDPLWDIPESPSAPGKGSKMVSVPLIAKTTSSAAKRQASKKQLISKKNTSSKSKNLPSKVSSKAPKIDLLISIGTTQQMGSNPGQKRVEDSAATAEMNKEENRPSKQYANYSVSNQSSKRGKLCLATDEKTTDAIHVVKDVIQSGSPPRSLRQDAAKGTNRKDSEGEISSQWKDAASVQKLPHNENGAESNSQGKEMPSKIVTEQISISSATPSVFYEDEEFPQAGTPQAGTLQVDILGPQTPQAVISQAEIPKIGNPQTQPKLLSKIRVLSTPIVAPAQSRDMRAARVEDSAGPINPNMNCSVMASCQNCQDAGIFGKLVNESSHLPSEHQVGGLVHRAQEDYSVDSGNGQVLGLGDQDTYAKKPSMIRFGSRGPLNQGTMPAKNLESPRGDCEPIMPISFSSEVSVGKELRDKGEIGEQAELQDLNAVKRVQDYIYGSTDISAGSSRRLSQMVVVTQSGSPVAYDKDRPELRERDGTLKAYDDSEELVDQGSDGDEYQDFEDGSPLIMAASAFFEGRLFKPEALNQMTTQKVHDPFVQREAEMADGFVDESPRMSTAPGLLEEILCKSEALKQQTTEGRDDPYTRRESENAGNFVAKLRSLVHQARPAAQMKIPPIPPEVDIVQAAEQTSFNETAYRRKMIGQAGHQNVPKQQPLYDSTEESLPSLNSSVFSEYEASLEPGPRSLRKDHALTLSRLYKFSNNLLDRLICKESVFTSRVQEFEKIGQSIITKLLESRESLHGHGIAHAKQLQDRFSNTFAKVHKEITASRTNLNDQGPETLEIMMKARWEETGKRVAVANDLLRD